MINAYIILDGKPRRTRLLRGFRRRCNVNIVNIVEKQKVKWNIVWRWSLDPHVSGQKLKMAV